jgi:hypothetical protein
MSDTFTTVTSQGFGSRIVSSFKNILIGFLLLVIGVVILYFNEGRIDLSKVAARAVVVDSGVVQSDTSLSGKLVTTTGIVSSDELIGDTLFLKPGLYFSVVRKVEMFAWEEDSTSHSTSHAGGSETTNTTYTYKKEWTENPSASASFKEVAGHENPIMRYRGMNTSADKATIGMYTFNPTTIDIPSGEILALSPEMLTLNPGVVQANSSYLFSENTATPGGSLDAPHVGDMRISYQVLRPGFTGTLFGAVSGVSLHAYSDGAVDNFGRLFVGSREQAISTLHLEYTTTLWVLRFSGFMLLFFGFSLVLGPVAVFFDILPMLGSVSRFVVSLFSFAVALVVTGVVIVVSMVAHSPMAIAITLLAVVGMCVLYAKRLARKTSTSVDTIQAVQVPQVPQTPQAPVVA